MKQERSINGVVNPFTDEFLPTWQLWKDFRKEEHNFSYKGCISEQMALKRLVEVSDGDEQKAGRIIEQSISRGWMDFYALKQPSNNGKGKSNSKAAKQSTDSIESRVMSEINKRYGGGQDAGSEPYLKAV